MILASQSPRRKELLDRTGLIYTIVPAQIDERRDDKLCAHEQVMNLARDKALFVQKQFPDELIIACDTLVFYKNRALGKPKDQKEAYNTISLLQGKTHQVYSGVCFVYQSAIHMFYEISTVEFYPVSPKEIHSYIQTDEPYDKAGAYGIQGHASLFIKSINGSYDNIVGLPLAKTYRELLEFCKIHHIDLNYREKE